MSPAFGFGKKKVFPNVGAWAKDSSGTLGIIYDIKDVTQDDGSPDSDNDEGAFRDTEPVVIRTAFLHPVDSRGNSITIIGVDGKPATKTIAVPADSLTKATYDDLKPLNRPGQVSMVEHAQFGYDLNSSDLQSLTALQRMQLGKSFNDEDKAQGLVEESEEHLAELKRRRVAKDKRAIAKEEEIEQKRQAFIAWAAAERQKTFDDIMKDLK